MELRALSGQLENGSEREENLHGSCDRLGRSRMLMIQQISQHTLTVPGLNLTD